MVKRGIKDLVGAANAAVETITVDEAKALHGTDGVLFVDLREAVELETSGTVPGAAHTPRGFLEFHMDPAFPMHNPALAAADRLVLFCGSGGRSALAAKTLLDMGVENACHIAGGFAAWRDADGPTEA